MATPTEIAYIVEMFFIIQISLKIVHWQTRSYSVHKGTDNLSGDLSDLIDQFIETIQGASGSRLQFTEDRIIPLQNQTKELTIMMLKEFNEFLINNNSFITIIENNPDLITIRDEIIGIINKSLYTLSLE